MHCCVLCASIQVMKECYGIRPCMSQLAAQVCADAGENGYLPRSGRQADPVPELRVNTILRGSSVDSAGQRTTRQAFLCEIICLSKAEHASLAIREAASQAEKHHYFCLMFICHQLLSRLPAEASHVAACYSRDCNAGTAWHAVMVQNGSCVRIVSKAEPCSCMPPVGMHLRHSPAHSGEERLRQSTCLWAELAEGRWLVVCRGRLRSEPFFIGVAGGTASGKTTVCQQIMHVRA